MKTFITIIGLLIASATQAQQTGFYYGTRGGLGESKFEGGSIENPSGKLFWQIGGTSAYQFHKNLGITADFLLTGRGTKSSGVMERGGLTGTKEFPYTESYSVLSGDIPLALKLSVGTGDLYFKVYGGYSINFHFGGVYNRTYEDESLNSGDHKINSLKVFDHGLVFGAGVEVKSGSGRLYFLDVRGSKGQVPLMTVEENIKQQYFALHAGYLFH